MRRQKLTLVYSTTICVPVKGPLGRMRVRSLNWAESLLFGWSRASTGSLVSWFLGIVLCVRTRAGWLVGMAIDMIETAML
jgi:hypothetical protein